MLTDYGVIQVLSGTSLVDTTTKTGGGSARWLAPEMLQSAGPDNIYTKEADVWAVGMIIYASSPLSE